MGWTWRGSASGAASGAAIGMHWGPWGAGIGGALGGLMGGLFGGGGGGPSRQDPRTTDYLKSAGHYGSFVPVLFGTRWVTLQVIQRAYVQVGGDFNTAVPQFRNANYWRIHGIVLAIAQGQIEGDLLKLTIDDIEYDLGIVGTAGLSLQRGGLDGNAPTIAYDSAGGTWDVYNPALAHLRGDPADLVKVYKDGPRYPAGSGETLGVVPEQINSTPSYRALVPGIGLAAGSLDCEPGQIISDVCMRGGPVWLGPPIWGAGWPAERLELVLGTNGLASSGFATYAKANGWRVSLLIDSQASAADVGVQVATACDAELVPSDGKLKVIPRGEVAIGDYVPDTQPVCEFGYDDYLPQGKEWGANEDPVSLTMAPDAHVYNVIPVEFRDRDRKDEVNTAEKPETADVNELVVVGGIQRPRGERRSPALSLPCISSMAHAEAISGRVARRAVHQRARYLWRAGWPFDFLEGMDVVLLNDEKLGLEKFPVRILKVERDPIGKNTFTAEAYLGEVGETVKVDMSQAA